MGKTIKADKIISESGIVQIVGELDAVSALEKSDLWKHSAQTYDNINYTKGKVSIGTTDATSNLQVEGNVYVSSNLEVGEANLFVDTETSNIGIGTRTPLTTLHVEGNVYASSNVGIGTSTPEYTLDVHGTANVGALTANTISGDGYLLSNILASAVVGGVGLWTINDGDNTIYYQTANVAIGKTDPTTELDVDGTVTATEFSGPLSGRATIATDADNATNVYVTTQTNQLDTRRIIFGPNEGTGNKSLFSDSKLNYVASSGTLTASQFVGGGGGITIPRLNTSNVNIGSGAGATGQNLTGVAIGNNAGNTGQGSSAIAIGSGAGKTNQDDNTIILNASGLDLNSEDVSRFYVKPVRSGTIAGNALAYTGTSEVVSETSLKFYESGNVEVGQANLFVDTTTSNVGIGKTNPNFTLDVNGDINFSGQFYQGGSQFVSTPWTIDTNPDALTYTAGNVGIGASNPSANLQVTGNVYVSSNLEVGEANLFVDTTTSNVGIGRTDPNFTLDVNGDINFSGQFYQGGSQFVITNINADNITSGTLDPARFSIPDLDASKITSGTLSRPVNTSGNITTTSTGRIGIGTTNPNHPLHVETSVSGVYNSAPGAISWGDASLSSLGRIVTSSSNNYDHPYDLSIYAKGSILTNDRLYVSTAVYVSSDRRIKTNIIDVEDSESLETLRKIKPRKYNYKDTLKRGNSLMWGFVADEVEEIIPYSVVNITNIAGNICKMGTVSSSNIITFTDFNTSNLEVSNATSIIEVLDGGFKHHNVHLAEIIDDHTIRVEEDLTEWVFGVDDLGNAVDGNNIYVRGQEITNFKQLEYQAIWTVATSALQEVDRQQQADKVRISQLETQVAELMSRVAALESS